MDTDSLIYDIAMDDFYKDIVDDVLDSIQVDITLTDLYPLERIRRSLDQ